MTRDDLILAIHLSRDDDGDRQVHVYYATVGDLCTQRTPCRAGRGRRRNVPRQIG